MFSKSAITDIVSDRTAVKIAPIRNPPVKSLTIPIMNGPANPPISAIQKNIPPTDPMYLAPTSGISIKMSIRSGVAQVEVRPQKTNPAMRRVPDAVAVINTDIVITKPNRATMRSRKCGATKRGRRRTAGIPTAMGMEAAKPAIAGGKPPTSRILGSQSLKP